MHCRAFHVFKVFVANPKKPPDIVTILYNNKDKIIVYLNNFHLDREDAQFVDEKRLLIEYVLYLLLFLFWFVFSLYSTLSALQRPLDPSKQKSSDKNDKPQERQYVAIIDKDGVPEENCQEVDFKKLGAVTDERQLEEALKYSSLDSTQDNHSSSTIVDENIPSWEDSSSIGT